MSRRTLVLSIIASVVLSGVIAYALAARRAALSTARGDPRASASASASASGGLPVLWQSPAFSFPDQNGRRTASSDLRGRAFIADFIFTSCTSVCPLITAKMALLQRRLERRRDLRFVSFSVDPARDTPEALKRYAESWRPGESRWLLFSTAPETLAALAAGMFVSIDPGEKDIAHSQLFFLVDAQGGVRGIYESDRDDALDRLVHDAESLLGAEPAAAEPASARPAGATGAALYASLGCGACHARAELAPPLEGLAGRRVRLEGGAELVADSGYVRESVTAPDAKRVAGYPLRMPSYDAVLTPPELQALVAHVGALAAAPAATGSAAAAPHLASSGTPPAPKSSGTAREPTVSAALSAAPAVAVDPVCSMDVRVTDATPRATHAGQVFYFCSPSCRERFVTEPARYANPAIR